VKAWRVEEPVDRRFPVVRAVVVPFVNENARPVMRPVFEIEKRVVVEVLFVVEAMAKRLVLIGAEVDAAKTVRRA
jgi:hypothetical protein